MLICGNKPELVFRHLIRLPETGGKIGRRKKPVAHIKLRGFVYDLESAHMWNADTLV